MNVLPPPGPERTRQLALLGVLTIVLAGFFGYRNGPSTTPAGASHEAVKGGGSDKGELPGVVKRADLHSGPDSSQLSRSPFRFGQPTPTPVTARPPAVQDDAPRPKDPPQQVGPPQIQLKLFGIEVVLGTQQRLAHLMDPDSGAVFFVAEGASFDGKYRLVKVNANSVVLSYLNGSGMKTVSLALAPGTTTHDLGGGQ